jgi:hypothetical protein
MLKVVQDHILTLCLKGMVQAWVGHKVMHIPILGLCPMLNSRVQSNNIKMLLDSMSQINMGFRL